MKKLPVESSYLDLLHLALFGVATCFVSLSMGFTIFRETRLAKGVPLALWESVTSSYTAIIFLLLSAVVLLLIFRRSGSWFPTGLAVAGNLLLISIFLALANASHFISADGSPFSRISLGAGSWLMLLGGYIITISAARESSSFSVRFILSYASFFIVLILSASGLFNHLSLIQEFAAKKNRFVQELYHHLSLSFSSVGLAVLIGIPLGILAYRKEKAGKSIFYFVNTTQTIPSLALFGLLIAPLSYLYSHCAFFTRLGIRGTGTTPALIALTLYALLPVTRNVYAGLKAVNPAVIQAGKGMGFNRLQLLLHIEAPLAAPVMLNGLRLAADPPILLMDEPFGAVDPLGRLLFQNEFLSIQQKLKKTVIFVTHDLDEAIRLADRIAIMKDGHIVQYDTPETILSAPEDSFVRDFIGADRSLKKLARFNAAQVMREALSVDITADSLPSQLQKLAFRDTAFVWATDAQHLLRGWIDLKHPLFSSDPLSGYSKIAIREVAVHQEDSLKLVLSKMLGQGIKNVPVISKHHVLQGEISLHDIEQVSES